MAYTVAVPDFRVILEGKDLTDRLRPRLVSLSLSEKRGGEADQLDIVIDDSDGRMQLPREGVRLSVQLGWKAGSEVAIGLVDKGSFIVDEVGHSGPPDIITIRARSADFATPLRTRRERSWHDSSIGAIVSDIASRNKLKPRVAARLASIAVKSLAQSRESDMALLRRLGREYDAVATIKAGTLIFAAVGAGTTSGGKAIPSATIRRRDGDRHSFTIEKRDDHAGVTASWHDKSEGRKKKVTAGEEDDAKRLSRVYPTEAAARAAAQAELRRLGRQPRKLSFDLALGRPDLYPERKVRAEGFKAEIDAISWLISEVSHDLTKDGGLTTRLQMEMV